MHIHRLGLLVLVTLVAASGCAALDHLIAPQANENLSLMPGTRAAQPSWIDGDLRSAGPSERPEKPDSRRFRSADTEAVVWLPEERRINEIIVHSDEIMSLDLWFETPSSGWQFDSRYAGLIGPKIVLDPKGLISASGVMILIREGIHDRGQRDKVLISNGVTTEVRGPTNLPVAIKEIEIMGPWSGKAANAGGESEGAATGEGASSPEDLLFDGLLD